MSLRVRVSALTRLAVVSASLMLCFHLVLPPLAVLPQGLDSQPALWAFFAPLVACLCAMAVALLGIAALHRSESPVSMAGLPVRVVVAFTAGALIALAIGAVLESHPLTHHRPLVVALCGPALVLIHALILKALIHPPLMAELRSIAARQIATDQRQPILRDDRWILSIRTSLLLHAGLSIIIALSLIGTHFYCMAQNNQERMTALHLEDMLEVVKGQLSHVPGWQVETFVAGYPASSTGTPALLDPSERLLTPLVGITPGSKLTVESENMCRINSAVYHCAMSKVNLPAADALVVLHSQGPDDRAPALRSLGLHLLLITLGLLAAATLMGWFIGNDISRDFRLIANQLDAMARQDEPDLGRPVAVTSIDEVGDLTAGLGKLRSRLESELAGYRDSLKKTQDAERKKNEFFSNVSQEIRTPLNVLSGYSQLLLEEDQGPLSSAQKEDIQSIHRGGQQLLALINDVLDISVIESGHLRLDRQRVDLRALCREVVEGHRHALKMDHQKSGRTALVLELEDKLPIIAADPRRLEQMISNLVSNALKFTHKGTVMVGVSREGSDSVCIQVQDTGIGISSVDLPNIFERYRQSGELRLKRKGSGLGLAICKHLVELHGGTISVRSEVELGSTFTIVLPVNGGAPGERAA